MKCFRMSLVSVTTASSSELFLYRTLYHSHVFSFPLHRRFQPLSSSAVLRRLPPCRATSPGSPLPPSDNDSSNLKGFIHRIFQCLIIWVSFVSRFGLGLFIIVQVCYGCSIARIFFPVMFRVQVLTVVVDVFLCLNWEG